jgi:hypothetical protein
MINFFKTLFKREPEAVKATTTPVKLAAQPIHINISNIGSIERNKARIARLERAIETGKGTPEIEAELEARKKSLADIAGLAQ